MTYYPYYKNNYENIKLFDHQKELIKQLAGKHIFEDVAKKQEQLRRDIEAERKQYEQYFNDRLAQWLKNAPSIAEKWSPGPAPAVPVAEKEESIWEGIW